MSSDKNFLKNTVKRYIISILISIVFFLVGVFITSFVLYSTNADSTLIFYIPYFFIVIGGLILSKRLYKNSNSRGFEVGIKTGVLYSVLIFLISFLFCFKVSVFSFLMVFVAILSCTVGGVLAANSRK